MVETILHFLEKESGEEQRVTKQMNFADDLVMRLNIQIGVPLEIHNKHYDVTDIDIDDDGECTHVFLMPVTYH